MTNREEDRPEIVALPPLIYLAFLFMGLAMDYFRPVTVVPASRLSRNPGYVALSLLYVGIGVAADNLWIVAGLVPILIVMQYGVIVREEQYLERTFGEEYLQYKASVRRWV